MRPVAALPCDCRSEAVVACDRVLRRQIQVPAIQAYSSCLCSAVVRNPKKTVIDLDSKIAQPLLLTKERNSGQLDYLNARCPAENFSLHLIRHCVGAASANGEALAACFPRISAAPKTQQAEGRQSRRPRVQGVPENRRERAKPQNSTNRKRRQSNVSGSGHFAGPLPYGANTAKPTSLALRSH